MELCRVCETVLNSPAYESASPSVSSLSTLIDVPTIVHVCKVCGHMQSVELPNVRNFYNTEYRISLQSDDFDQLYDVVNGDPIYRTDYQFDLMMQFASPPQGAAVLDYGAAKAHSLRNMLKARPDIRPHVFDVSEDYRGYWQDWIDADNQATYSLPLRWAGHFDLVTAHFVLEHIATPVDAFRDIANVLRTGGRLFFTVPDAVGNPGDMVVVDHINHFTVSSLAASLDRAGLKIEHIDRKSFRGAFTLVAQKVDGAVKNDFDLVADLTSLETLCGYWRNAEQILRTSTHANAGKPAAIYGAGVYGVFVAAHIKGKVDLRCFLDQNPHVAASGKLLGLPVFLPMDLPEGIAVLFAGLNPRIAHDVLENLDVLKGRSVARAYLD
jgi:SAM-dependent methyltransferase